ncbi:MAG: bifunctional (p)ppGpp synthetase/guanosine-3',5'-bis(diphosphate) 3'-pyrophosphohydrolase [SAR324 cluster bacterium]|nr:bifunctional (p)ppGpp synthetase/guanosine-3',5'-bis(diphosphate) 3'-pyrophosphohydrolase [SAR324 cluster bacterium]
MNSPIKLSDPLLATIKNLESKIEENKNFSAPDIKNIKSAIKRGLYWHNNQTRDTGGHYFIHPVRIAIRCLDFGADCPLICAALLHDVLEDTTADYPTIENEFGEEVAKLVKALTRFKKEERSISADRIFRLAQRDLRVLLIKIMDRLDNLLDLKFLSRSRQRKKATESIIYAAVAEGIGLKSLADEFRNQAFSVLYPLNYSRVMKEIEKICYSNQPLYNKVKNSLWSTLGTETCRNIDYELKEPYDFLDPNCHIINILRNFTLLVDNVLDCYHVLGILHTNLKTLPLRFHDYLTNPLANGLSGLETTVICHGLKVQIWITTTHLHAKNKRGIFNLISKKIYNSEQHQRFIEEFAELFSEKNLDLEDIFRSQKNPLNVIKWRSPSENYFQVSTPKGKILQMYYGSTVLDFAFAIHSEIGLTCIGAIINESYRVESSYLLQEGNIVEVLTEKNATPDESWLKNVIMPYSRKEIMLHFRRSERESKIKIDDE